MNPLIARLTSSVRVNEYEVVTALDRYKLRAGNATRQRDRSLVPRVLVLRPVHDQRRYADLLYRPAVDLGVRALLEVVPSPCAVQPRGNRGTNDRRERTTITGGITSRCRT